MGLFSFVKNMYLYNARRGIRNTIKEGRIEYVSQEQVRFTNKNGIAKVITLDELANKVMEQTGLKNDAGAYGGVSGVKANMVLDISIGDIKQIIKEEYNKQEAKK